MIINMEINEKTRVNFSGEKYLGIIAGVILAVWGVHTYISKQTQRDDSQDVKIERVDNKVDALDAEFQKSQTEINLKLDKIIQKQDTDHDIVVRHEYSNLNKPYYSK